MKSKAKEKKFLEEHPDLYIWVNHQGENELKSLGFPQRWSTLCEIRQRSNDVAVVSEISNCHPADQPVRKIGRAIAVGRAIKRFENHDAV